MMLFLKTWCKKQQTPFSRGLYSLFMVLRYFQLPVIPGFHRFIYVLHRFMADGIQKTVKICYFSPLFRARLSTPRPKRLCLFGPGMPYIYGPLCIIIGSDCRICGKVDLSGRTDPENKLIPKLQIGNNVDIAFGTCIAVGTKIIVGNNVIFSGQAFMCGYPGHPLNAKNRADHMPDRDSQIGDIMIEDDVWIGKRVYVGPNVRIGKGSVIAYGSVVTHDIPAGVLAGGVPAKVIRKLD